MNNKIFVVLALASLFISTQAAIAQIVCLNAAGTTDSGCASCPTTAAGSCTTCKTGYYKVTTAAGLVTCTACATNCDACTSNTVCTTPSSGYFLASGAPSACATNCLACTSNTVCTTPATGYFLASGAPSACATNCNACTSNTVCTTPATGYFLASGAPSACATNCDACTSNTVCTTASAGYFLASGAPSACATNCKACTSNTVCTTANTGYFLASGAPSACADTLNAVGCTAQYTVTTCTFGTIDTQTMCCGVAGCATCGAPATIANSNNVCATCSEGYLLVSGACNACTATNCATCPTAVGTCATCKTGYTLTGTGSSATCVASTPVPSTNSPSSAFNITPVAVYTSTDTTAPAFTAVSGTTIYGPGFDSTTAYVWLVIPPTVSTGTYTVNRRTINTTAFSKSNSSADTAITTSIGYTAGWSQWAVAPGYLILGSEVDGSNWNTATATASEVSITYIAGNGTATTKAITGNTNTNVFYDVKDVFYLNGTAYIIYSMKTRTAGTATVADSFALNGIYIHGVVLSTGALLNYTTGGVKAIPLTQSNTGTIGLTCTVGTTCASEPSSQVSSFMVGVQNFTQNVDTVWYLWDDRSTSNAYTIKLGSINVTTGAATSGTTLTTTAASSGAGTTASPLLSTSYSIGGFHGSDAGSFGAYVNKLSTSTASSVTTYTSTILSFINGTSTTQSTLYSLTPTTGYSSVGVQGFATTDGFILLNWGYSQTSPTPAQPLAVQAQRFYTNGTAYTTSPVALGTFADSPQAYQDTNGSIVFGYSPHDTIQSKTYSGYMGSYVVQSMAASTLTSIFAFLSILIVALFAF